jgi:hypothetical protein
MEENVIYIFLINNFRWIKILNNKLLIFNSENSNKANIIYDLTECEIRANSLEITNLNINTGIKNELTTGKKNSNSTKNLITVKNDKNGKKVNSSSTNKILKFNSDVENYKNYEIEIDHPYLQKCLIKSESIFETLEFYSQIKNLVN